MSEDRVLTINGYYDAPRLGVAELNGVPHIYEAEFDDVLDEYGDTYFLSPIDADLLALVLEDWEIWCRWHRAYSGNEVGLDSHPALTDDRPRHEELKRLIGDRLHSDPANRKRYKGAFSTPEAKRGTWNNLADSVFGTAVRWRPE